MKDQQQCGLQQLATDDWPRPSWLWCWSPSTCWTRFVCNNLLQTVGYGQLVRNKVAYQLATDGWFPPSCRKRLVLGNLPQTVGFGQLAHNGGSHQLATNKVSEQLVQAKWTIKLIDQNVHRRLDYGRADTSSAILMRSKPMFIWQLLIDTNLSYGLGVPLGHTKVTRRPNYDCKWPLRRLELEP